jgi:hypothetical protein
MNLNLVKSHIIALWLMIIVVCDHCGLRPLCDKGKDEGRGGGLGKGERGDLERGELEMVGKRLG